MSDTQSLEAIGPNPARLPRSARMREIATPLAHSPTFVIGAVIVLLWVLDAVFWRVWAPHDPLQIGALPLEGPSGSHLLGTDNLGRDVLSRMLAGASSVLTVAPLAALLGVAGGTVAGLLAGYYGGLVDDVLMRIVDGLLAFPVIILAVLVLATLGGSEINVILVIGIVFIPIVTRTVRSAVLAERDREYVAAAELCGESRLRIMFIEILPNISGPIIVEGTLRVGFAAFAASTLSFLSLGLQPPSPDWGLSISQGQTYLQLAPWIALAPALALASLIVGINLVADGMREALAE